MNCKTGASLLLNWPCHYIPSQFHLSSTSRFGPSKPTSLTLQLLVLCCQTNILRHMNTLPLLLCYKPDSLFSILWSSPIKPSIKLSLVPLMIRYLKEFQQPQAPTGTDHEARKMKGKITNSPKQLFRKRNFKHDALRKQLKLLN